MAPTFSRLTKAQRRIHLDRSLKAGDTTRPSRDPHVWLVSSDTLSTQYGRPVFWRVNVRTATCGCPGYRSKGCCRHVARGIYEWWHATHQAPANVVPFRHAA